MYEHTLEYDDRIKTSMINEESEMCSYSQTDREGTPFGNQILFSKGTGEILMNRFVDKQQNVKTTHYQKNQVVAYFQEKYVNGEYVKHGSFERYKEGKVIELGGYNNGKKHGRWITVDPKTKKIDIKRYENGHDVTGLEEKQAAKEIMAGIGDLVDVMEERSIGRATQKLMHNLSKFTELFKKDEIPNIKVDFEKVPALEVGKTEYGYSTFYDDGSLNVFAQEAKKLENGTIQFSGVYLEHYDEGGVKIKTKYNSRGELDGKYQEFHPNGTLKLEGQYISGEKEGIFKEYDVKGNVTKEESFTLTSKGSKLKTEKEESKQQSVEKEKQKKKNKSKQKNPIKSPVKKVASIVKEGLERED